MKKIGSILIIIVGIVALLFLFSACTDANTSSFETSRSTSEGVTITKGELTEREDFLLSSLTEHTFLYDYSLSEDVTELTVFVEKYEFGKRQDYPIISMSMADLNSEGTLFFSVGPADFEIHSHSLSVGIQSEGNWSSGRSFDSFVSDSNASMGTVRESAVSDENSLSIEDDAGAVASIIHANSEEGISTLTKAFYEDIDNNLEQIEDYEVVYVFKVAVSDEAVTE